MANEAPDGKSSEAPDGVFGNLPAARPGTRSPRRHPEGSEAPDRVPLAAAAKRSPAPPPAPPPPPEPKPPPGAERDAPVAPDPATEPRINSVEDLAWAGVAVAAQAATVGVRFASRALDAARKSVDRS